MAVPDRPVADRPVADRPVLVVNAGGMTLKMSVVDESGVERWAHDIDPWEGDAAALGDVASSIGSVGAVGHRFVHGGAEFAEATVIDDGAVELLERLTPLAPLHQTRALTAVRALRTDIDVPHVACFDTTFHRTIPEHAATYALPAAWRQRWPLLRRFGFHGFSHEHVAHHAGRIADLGADRSITSLRIVSCHLASGASLCAIANGTSVDTTMGMTPLDGLVMATRSGSVDPGLVLWLAQESGLGVDEIARGMRDHSGLRGLAGGSGDMREVLAGRERGDPDAELAYGVYVHRLRREIGAMAAVLGGVDVLAFTGGVGQNIAAVRADATAGLGHLGLAISPELNEPADADADITACGANAATVVVSTNEHTPIAHCTRAALV
jgi:acetate kinase